MCVVFILSVVIFDILNTLYVVYCYISVDETENDSGSVVNEDFVQVLTAEKFYEAIDKNPTILVEFYTPWFVSYNHI